MDVVTDSLSGWSLVEAMERTSDPDPVGHEAAGASRQKIALWERLSKGLLVLTGCFDTPSAAPVVIDPQDLSALDWAGESSTILVGGAGSNVEVFNVRVFPILRAPNAANHLDGLSLTDAFRRYVLNDPEVAGLGKRVVNATKRHAGVFRDGLFPGLTGDFHWQLDATDESIAYNFVTQPLGVDEWLPTPSAMISAVSAALADRLQGLRQVLSAGSICASGTFARSGVVGPIDRLQWMRPGMSIDVSRGDLCEGQDFRAVALWTGLSLRLADAPPPVNQSQNGEATKVTKARAQVQTKEKCRLECLAWLEAMMRASRDIPSFSRDELWDEAKKKWPQKLSRRKFIEARTEAIKKTGAWAWADAGRRKR